MYEKWASDPVCVGDAQGPGKQRHGRQWKESKGGEPHVSVLAGTWDTSTFYEPSSSSARC